RAGPRLDRSRCASTVGALTGVRMPTALVTGSSRGIGRGIALALGGLGWHVVVNYAGNQSAADECCELVRAAGGTALAVQGDVGQAGDRARLLAETLRWQPRLDLLVNNAGVAPNVRADLLDADEASFDRLIGINLKGPYFLTQAVARHMLTQAPGASGDRGQIVNVSSISAYTASVNRGDYCVTKAGIGMMTALF